VEIHPYTTITYLAAKKVEAAEGESIDIQFLFRRSQNDPTTLQSTRKKSTQWTNKLSALVDEEKSQVHVRQERKSSMELELPDTASDVSVKTTMRMEGPYFTPANPELYKTVVCLVAGTGLSGALAIAAAFKARKQRRVAESNTAVDTAASTPTPVAGIFDDEAPLWERCIVLWTVREKDYIDIPYINGEPQLGRPDSD
jgi:hypothetical protein